MDDTEVDHPSPFERDNHQMPVHCHQLGHVALRYQYFVDQRQSLPDIGGRDDEHLCHCLPEQPDLLRGGKIGAVYRGIIDRFLQSDEINFQK